MAPTILGDYWEAPCPRCGQPAYGTPLDLREHQPADSQTPLAPGGVLMVCSKEHTSVSVKEEPKVRGGSDHVVVCKFIGPRRWDIIVFRYPADRSRKFAKRVVGLPGENLEIRDGAVWINGKKLDPPEAIRGIHYSPTIVTSGQTFSGPGSVPVKLGPDEYFVLGDFVDASSDSRLWEQGAPGHPPYAVPASYIEGVVINIYWPISRWTSFR
jgi:signal peptidase I